MNPNTSRLGSAAFVVFLISVILTPIAFLPSPYVALDLVKTIVIVAGSVVAALLLTIQAIKDKKMALPPRSIVWTSALIIVSMLVSSLLSLNISKSLFGQGFEINTFGFTVVLFLAAYSAFAIVAARKERAVILYTGMVAGFLVVYLFQFLRILFGPDFATMSIFLSSTSSMLGNWYSLASISGIVGIISLSAIIFLPLSKQMKIVYCIPLILSLIGLYIINYRMALDVLALVLLGYTIFMSYGKYRKAKIASGDMSKRAKPSLIARNIAWLPLVSLIIVIALARYGNVLASPVINATSTSYFELSLPWQYTLDVTSGAVKGSPIFGIGPNQFSKAYTAFKPAGINQTDFWSAEFNNGFGLIPTFVASQGVVGTIAWLLFLVFFAICGAKALKKLPEDQSVRFMAVSSFSGAVFVWLMSMVSVPTHTIVFFGFILTGIFFGTASASGLLTVNVFEKGESRITKLFPQYLMLALIVIALVGVIYVKKTAALAYFGSGVKQLNAGQDGGAIAADKAFAKAVSLDASDIYYQARAEANLAIARKLAASADAKADASSSEELAKQVIGKVNEALTYSRSAIAFDPTNYYNYISEARVSEDALRYGMANSFENAVTAYKSALNLYPANPAIYLNLARLQASQNKLDDALQTAGTAIQVKNNYIDAVFLLSQISAAKGDLPNAINAVKYAININPNNALLYFQLGILQYNAQAYSDAVTALAKAVEIEPQYANAQYFLGLSYARLNKNAEALQQFEALAQTNPDNQEVALILSNLRAGKSPFADAKPPVTAQPEKRSTLPIQTKTKK